MRNVYLFPGHVDAGAIKAYLKTKDVDADVTCHETLAGTTVDIESAQPFEQFLAGFVPPERGQKRKELRERLETAKSIADIRGIMSDVIDGTRFPDD